MAVPWRKQGEGQGSGARPAMSFFVKIKNYGIETMLPLYQIVLNLIRLD